MKSKTAIIVTILMILVASVSYSVFALRSGGPKAAALLPNAPPYICSEGMPPSTCAQLKLTCGNGIVDPGEDCRNCAFDAGCAAGLICGNLTGGDEYACHYPAGLCLAGPAG